jgi:hypothetical protein
MQVTATPNVGAAAKGAPWSQLERITRRSIAEVSLRQQQLFPWAQLIQ